MDPIKYEKLFYNGIDITDSGVYLSDAYISFLGADGIA